MPASAASNLAALDKLATEYDVTIAIDSNTDPKGSGNGAIAALMLEAYRSVKPLVVTFENVGTTEADLLRQINAFEACHAAGDGRADARPGGLAGW